MHLFCQMHTSQTYAHFWKVCTNLPPDVFVFWDIRKVSETFKLGTGKNEKQSNVKKWNLWFGGKDLFYLVRPFRFKVQTRRIYKPQIKPQHTILNPKISTPCDRQQGAILVCVSMYIKTFISFHLQNRLVTRSNCNK